jgi:hypothetical protein
LGGSGGWEVENHHFNNDVSGIEPSGHNNFQEMFSDEFLFFLSNLNVNGFKHFFGLFFISFHNGSGDLDDRSHDELTETSNKGFSLRSSVFIFLPFFVTSIEVIVSPKFFHHFVDFDLEFNGIDLSKSSKGEGPLIFSRSESNITFLGVKKEVSHGFDFIVGYDNVNHINNSDEILIHRFGISLKFEDRSIDFVNHQHWSNSFSHSLSKHGFGLDADTFDGIDDNQSSIGNSESGGDFRREINVSGGIDQVNQKSSYVSVSFDVIFVIEGDTSRFNGDTSFFLIISGIHVSGVTSNLSGNNTGFGDKGIRKS